MTAAPARFAKRLPMPPPVTRGLYRSRWFEFLNAHLEDDPRAAVALADGLSAEPGYELVGLGVQGFVGARFLPRLKAIVQCAGHYLRSGCRSAVDQHDERLAPGEIAGSLEPAISRDSRSERDHSSL